MKRFFLSAAVLAVALSSCSKNEIADNTNVPSNAIGFGTYLGSATKADSKTAFDTDAVFAIDAYYTATDAMVAAATPAKFMQNQIVETADAGASWSYSPIKYWPNNDNEMVSFFAVTDATNASPITDFETLTGNKPSFTITGAASDIMIASALNVEKQAAAVAFKFQHTMSQVNFTAKTTNTFGALDNTTIKVTSLTVNYGAGNKLGGASTFTFDNETANTGSWGDGDAERAEDVFDAADPAVAGDVTDAGINTDLVLESDAITIGAPIMIMPNDAASYTVTVLYDVTTTDSVDAANSSTITNKCTFAIKPMLVNTIYNYNLQIGLTAVEVEGDVTNWTAATVVDKAVAVESSTTTL